MQIGEYEVVRQRGEWHDVVAEFRISRNLVSQVKVRTDGRIVAIGRDPARKEDL